MNVKTFKKTYKKSVVKRKATPESESNQKEIVIKYLRLAYICQTINNTNKDKQNENNDENKN